MYIYRCQCQTELCHVFYAEIKERMAWSMPAPQTQAKASSDIGQGCTHQRDSSKVFLLVPPGCQNTKGRTGRSSCRINSIWHYTADGVVTRVVLNEWRETGAGEEQLPEVKRHVQQRSSLALDF